MSTKVWTTICGVAIMGPVALIFVLKGSDSPESGPLTAQPSDTVQGKPLATPRGFGSHKTTEQMVYHKWSTGFVQRILYGEAYNILDPTSFAVLNYDDPFALTASEVFEFSASFDIIQAVGKGRDHFYLLGTADSGDSVIERWKKANVGTPGGSSYAMKRTELFRGTSLGEISGIGVDHQGRFLMLLHGEPAVISKMSLPSGQPITTVYNSIQIPELNDFSGGLFPRLHYAQGITWTINASGDFVLLNDPDDDGIMNSWSVFDHDTYWNNFSYTVWSDDFITQQP